ncbi:xylose ABC transporter membrane protein [Planifilum fulgidum]|uniref:Xylose transport system permease protein XylH n=1 Tax=Planifilum fulgidum TaxID=201973 RepID=A0A1I2MEP9_9BACL|nr:sugar ABC transporter permease [Planifilum fulgidum]SFF89932.1 xylose ABC transporter membrane protein [Planifilum fulgidum]
MRKALTFDLRAYGLIIALAFIALLFTVLTDGDFLSSRNLSNLFRQMSVISILAIGMTLVIITGHIDLSVGSLVGLAGGMAAILQVWYGWDTVSVLLLTLLAGLLLGAWQGWWVAYRGVPSFIVTLGGMLIFRGILIGISKGETVAPLKESFQRIGQSYLSYAAGYILAGIAVFLLFFLTALKRKKRRKWGLKLEHPVVSYGKMAGYSVLILAFVYMMNRYLGIPVPILFVLFLLLIFGFVLNRTRFGRYLYAIGGNSEAARYSGINVKRHIFAVFVIMGLLSSLAGLILTARLNAATVGAGQMFELDAIAACVIGGTSLKGGTGSVTGSIIGALVMVSLDNGMSMLDIDPFWQYIVKGFILILAVWWDLSSDAGRERS